MNTSCWTSARSLAERRDDGPPDAASARRRASWEQSLPDGLFDRAIGHLLDDPVDVDGALSGWAAPDVQPPAWCFEVERALAARPFDSSRQEVGTPLESGGRHVADRFVAAAREALETHRHARADAVGPLAATIRDGIAGLCHRALALELEATRLAEGWPAEKADARAWSLVDGFADRARVRALLEENPCIARMAGERLRLSVAACGRVLDHLASDLHAVDGQIAPGALEESIVAITAMGDRHDGCRQVLKITFRSGAEVMYKPRSLATDVAYDALLAALVERGFEPAFRTLPTLAAGPDRGWQAVAVAESCNDSAAVTRYFERLGGQLAALYALRATDMHFENVVAAGEHPVIVDLETLLQPRIGAGAANLYDPLLGESGVSSVLRVGILPRPDGPIGVDLSGIGRDPDAAHGISQDSWVGWTMDPERAQTKLDLGDNAARLGGVPVRPQEHVDALAVGFERAYRLLLAGRSDMLAEGGALAAFWDCGLRVLLRPTQIYVFVKRQLASKHACLSDGLAQEEVMHVLWRSARERPDIQAVVLAERHDLWVGDVPRFGASPGSADLFHHEGGRLEGALGDHPCPGPDVVMRLSEEDLERQLSFLRTSVSASAGTPDPHPRVAPSRPQAATIATPELLVDAAAAVASRLARLALRDGEEAGWLCLVDRCPPREGAVLASTWLDHADGQPGIAWFLGDLAKTRDNAEVAALAAASAARLRTLVGDGGSIEPEHGGGLLLALTQHGEDWSRTLADTLLTDESELAGPALAAWVIGLALADGAGPVNARERLSKDAGRLADASAHPHLATPLAARALAEASAVLDSSPLRLAALDALERAKKDERHQAPALEVLAWAPLARSSGSGDSRIRDGLGRLLPSLLRNPSPSRSTAEALLDALALRTAADALEDEGLLEHGLDRTDAALDDLRRDGDLTYDRQFETPGLRDGLAGIGVTLLALSRDQRSVSESALMLSRTMPRRVERIGPSDASQDAPTAGEAAV